MKESYKEVFLDSLSISPRNVRKEVRQEGIPELAENIKEVGMIHTIVVDKDNAIICGQRRFYALKRIQAETGKPMKITVKVVDDIEEELKTGMSLAEHFQRIDPFEKDVKEAIEYLYGKYKNVRKVAKLTGLSIGSVFNLLMTFDDMVKQKMDEAEVSSSRQVEIGRVLQKSPLTTNEEMDAVIEFAKKAPTSKLKEIENKAQQNLPINWKQLAEEAQKLSYASVFLSLPKDLHELIQIYAKRNNKIIQEVIIEVLQKTFISQKNYHYDHS